MTRAPEALGRRLGPVVRTIAWAPLLAGAAGCLAFVGPATGMRGSPALAQWPGFGALALCAGAAFLFDDAAAATTGATPTSLARRRLLRIALALPLLCGVWAVSLHLATTADGAAFATQARGGLSLQFAAMLALTLAASAVALRVVPGEHGGWTGALAPFVIVAAAVMLPERWTLLATPDDGAWQAAQQRWMALLALGLLTLVWACREPAGGCPRAARRRLSLSER